MHPCDMPHSVHVAPCYLICAFSRGNHGYGARCYILPLGSTPRVGIRGGHERNRTQPDAPVHDDRAVYCSCQKQTSYTFRGYVLKRDVTKFQGYTLLAV